MSSRSDLLLTLNTTLNRPNMRLIFRDPSFSIVLRAPVLITCLSEISWIQDDVQLHLAKLIISMRFRFSFTSVACFPTSVLTQTLNIKILVKEITSHDYKT